MSSQHKAPLAAFFVVSIACIVVVVNALRSDAFTGIFVRPTQVVIAGARLVPAPQDILNAEAKVVTHARTALSVAHTVVDHPARAGAAPTRHHRAQHSTSGAAEPGRAHGAAQAAASAPAAVAVAPVVPAAPVAPAAPVVPVKHLTPHLTPSTGQVRPPAGTVTHPSLSAHLPEAPAPSTTGHGNGWRNDHGQIRLHLKHGNGPQAHIGPAAQAKPSAASGVRSGSSYGAHYSVGGHYSVGSQRSDGHASAGYGQSAGHSQSSGGYGHSYGYGRSSGNNGWHGRR